MTAVYHVALMILSEAWQAAILGILQGLTEFLPISSSAHLILLPWLFGWTPMGIVFDVVIHGGTFLAVLIYFRQDWKKFTLELLERLRNREWLGGEASLVDAVVVGTVPAVLVALLLRDFIEEHGRHPQVTIVTLALFGLLLLWADRKSGGRSVGGVSLRDGLILGAAQALALVPGVSRSGVTITAALLIGFSRPEAARFSFLLAGPVIALGTLNGLVEMATGAEGPGAGWQVVAVGTAVSFLVGFLCIKYFLRFLQRATFTPFVVYRLALAACILILFWTGWRN